MRLETFMEVQEARVKARLEGNVQRAAIRRPVVGEKVGEREPYHCSVASTDPIKFGYKKLGILYE